jgi:hypothetical protein
MSKKEALEKITTARRQLNRMIFTFERKPDGEFGPTLDPKLSQEEMQEALALLVGRDKPMRISIS